MGNVKQPYRPGTYVSYFDRFPDKVAADGARALIEMYGAKYPRLRKQWEDRIAAYEFGQAVNIWM